ncbi:MAG TPA: hypothetical protein VEJ63_18160 [Planctomycetota bacterium]|nr:hypothetical protein [Planctomycetota bacterium]
MNEKPRWKPSSHFNDVISIAAIVSCLVAALVTLWQTRQDWALILAVFSPGIGFGIAATITFVLSNRDRLLEVSKPPLYLSTLLVLIMLAAWFVGGNTVVRRDSTAPCGWPLESEIWHVDEDGEISFWSRDEPVRWLNYLLCGLMMLVSGAFAEFVARKCDARLRLDHFQFHLSTMVLLMMVAAIYTWLNLDLSELAEGKPYAWTKSRGFPFSFQTLHSSNPESEYTGGAITWYPLGLNCIFGLSGLALIGYVSERIIRRKRATP